MNGSKIILKFARQTVFVLTFFVGITAVSIFAQTAEKAVGLKQEKIQLTEIKQNDVELINLAKSFSDAFKDADAEKMNLLLADDFQYFTNVPCHYKDCERGANKEDYTSGVVEERRAGEFSVASLRLKTLKPIINQNDSAADKKVSFYCELTTQAKGKTYKFYSFINYYFRKTDDAWKISKIENQIVQ